MARMNVKISNPVFTHEGAPAYGHMTPEQALRRSVLSCLLWEDQFYEDGQSIADRIVESAKKVAPSTLALLAIEVRSKFNLRHVPLLLASVLADTAKGTPLVANTLPNVIQRADELAEFLAVYASYRKVKPSELKKVLTHGIRRGLAAAFGKFNAYSLAKYNRDNGIKLRDVLFLCHAKPKDDEQKAMWSSLIDGTLASPDTWEVELSAGKNKGETFARLIREGKLGYLALLRNLRNMAQTNVDTGIVREAILARKGAQRVFPFRYIAASRAAPQFEPFLDLALQAAILELPRLEGKTIILVDVSGSMDAKLSSKSDMTRADAAAALASIINGDVRVFTFSNSLVEVPPRRGMAGVDAVLKSQPHGGTELGAAIQGLNQFPRDRLIVITDEQSHDRVLAPPGRKYLINTASFKNGVGYSDGWVHIDGFSENVIRFIHEYESQNDASATQ